MVGIAAVSGSFTVGALAVASKDANAVGAVRLTLLPHRLEVELLRAGAFHDGYVPGGLTRFVRFTVPYSAVRGLVRRERGVVLALDPAAATPHNRFFLTHFTDLPLEALASVHKRRFAARWAAWLVPLPLAAWLSSAVPASLADGVVGRASMFALLMLALGALLRGAAGWVETGGPLSRRLQSALEHRLARRMGYAPELSHETDPFEVPEALAIARPQAKASWVAPATATPASRAPSVAPAKPPALGSFGWARFATAALALAVTLVALGGVRLLGRVRAEPEAMPIARAGLEPVAGPTEEELFASALPSCSCDRADSPLWQTGLPVLTLLPIPKAGKETIAPEPNRRGRYGYDFDLAVVNNAAEALKDVRVLLTFARRNERDERVGVTDRGLFWEGLLGPAKSVKWRVRAPGTEVRIDLDEKRLLSETAPASAEGFEKLLMAKQPAVRLHAAMMLAYLGDSRAEQAARSLGELSGESALTQARILRAIRPLKLCNAKVEGDTLEVCAHNGGKERLRAARVVEVTESGTGRTRDLSDAIPPNGGLRFKLPGFGPLPEELALEGR